ncbi:hypothetical protein ACOSP7_015024 [Xanthoceras sorbifolium]
MEIHDRIPMVSNGSRDTRSHFDVRIEDTLSAFVLFHLQALGLSIFATKNTIWVEKEKRRKKAKLLCF